MATAGERAESSVNIEDGRQECQTVTGQSKYDDNRACNIFNPTETKTVLC